MLNIDDTLLIPQNVPLPNSPDVINPIPLVFGIAYVFQKAGLALPPHKHTEDLNHYSVVMSGSFKLSVVGQDDRVVKQLDIIDLPANVEHSFVALEDNSVVLNIRQLHTSTKSMQDELDMATKSVTELQKKLGDMLNAIVATRQV
jgi:quercetin dioxygenase-like cupin family protein